VKYRPDLVILLDILKSLDKEGVTISHICTYSNMPNPRVKEKLNQMIEGGLIEEVYTEDGKRLYRITDKGIKTRNKIRELVILLSELGLINVDRKNLI